MTFAQLWKSADWYCALTLCERVPIRGNLSNQSLSDAAGTKQARERLLLWKQLHCFTSRASFNERLAMDGLTESDLLHLLRETPEDLRQRVGYRPEWLKLLESAFEQSSTSTANNAKPANKETPQDRKAFVALVKPLVTYGRKYLRKRLARIASQHDHHPLGPDHCDSLFAPMLLERLLVLVQRTAILDLNVRRLLGHLEGESPQQRFQSYAQLLDDPTYSLGLLAEYPLLAREAVVYVNQWISFVSCVFEHLHTDWPLISSTFCVDLSDRIQRIHRTSAETHFGGRVVLILDLQSGSKLVYKPRSVATEEHFQHLLEWLNSVKPPPYFRILRVLDRDDHGWCEYVPSKECHSREAVRRFYERLGGYLALLYTLSGTDFHHENIIASGEHPVIIDLETLFHPDTQQGRKHRGEAHIIEHAFWESVMATGLLPLHVWANSEYEGIDLSAVGADQDQLTPDEIPIIEADGSDAIRVVRARFRLHSGYHQPRLNGRLMEISQFAEYFVSGFELTYDTILTHRKDLTDTQGLLSRFRGSVLRVILRPTRTYSLLLQESLHPDLLKDGLDRERFFDQLWLKSAASHQSTLVLLAERESLYKGDVPVFATKAGDRDLWCNGQLLHTDFFRRSGMELAMDRIGDMCDADRDRQCWTSERA